MNIFSDNKLQAWIAQLVGPLDSIDWEGQRVDWLALRDASLTPAQTIHEAIHEGRVIDALEEVAGNPQILEIAKNAGMIDAMIGPDDAQPLGLSVEDAERLGAIQLQSDGPVWTAYRYAVRTGDEALKQRCATITRSLEKKAQGSESSLFQKWTVALGDAGKRRSAANQQNAATERIRTKRRKIGGMASAVAVVAIGLVLGSFYLNTKNDYTEAADLFENELQQGILDARFQLPESMLPLEVFPSILKRLEALRELRKELNVAYQRIQELVANFESETAEAVLGEFDIDGQAQALYRELDSLSAGLRGELDGRVREAVRDYKVALAAKISEQEGQFALLVERLLSLQNSIEESLDSQALEDWLMAAGQLQEAYAAWKSASITGINIDASLDYRLNSLESEVEVVASVLKETKSALEVLEAANAFETAQEAIERLAGLKSTGIKVVYSERAERSLPFWRERLIHDSWIPNDPVSKMWIQRASEINLSDFSYSRATAALITDLLSDPAFIDVWQYFRYNYASSQTSSLVYTRGPVESDETLLDELREIYLVSQELALLGPSGASVITSTANRDGLGRYRGVVYNDGILTMESRVAKQLSDLWDSDRGVFISNPLPVIQTLIYDPRLSPVFRAFMLTWAVDTLGLGQDFFEVSWIPELIEAHSLLEQSGLEIDRFSWLSDTGDSENIGSLLGSAPMSDWPESLAAVRDLLESLSEMPLSFAGVAGFASWEGKSDEEVLYFTLDPESRLLSPLIRTEAVSSSLWLPVFSGARPQLENVMIGEMRYPEPVLFWNAFLRAVPEGLREILATR